MNKYLTKIWLYLLFRFNQEPPKIQFLFLIFGGLKLFLWVHWYSYFGLLVTSPLGFKARVAALFAFGKFPEIHLWCDTCWPLGRTIQNLNSYIIFHWILYISPYRLNLTFAQYTYIDFVHNTKCVSSQYLKNEQEWAKMTLRFFNIFSNQTISSQSKNQLFSLKEPNQWTLNCFSYNFHNHKISTLYYISLNSVPCIPFL